MQAYVKSQVIDWPKVEAAAHKVLETVRSGGVLANLGKELLLIRNTALRVMRRLLRRWFGKTPRPELLDLALDWFTEDFCTGWKGFDLTRPLKPFLNRVLWRRFARHARTMDRNDRHLRRVYAFRSMIRGEVIDPAFELELGEIREVVSLALFKLSPVDQSNLALWSSDMPTREIAELLQMDDMKWFRLSRKARQAFIKVFQETWKECGLPLDELPIASKRAKVSRGRARNPR